MAVVALTEELEAHPYMFMFILLRLLFINRLQCLPTAAALEVTVDPQELGMELLLAAMVDLQEAGIQVVDMEERQEAAIQAVDTEERQEVAIQAVDTEERQEVVMLLLHLSSQLQFPLMVLLLKP